MQLFAFLDGVSPWWWVAFGLALGAIEMATMTFFLIWPAIAALVVAVILLIAPETGGPWQIVAFGVVAIALTFVGRMLLLRFGDGAPQDDTLNSRSSLMIGRSAEVIEVIGTEGRILIDGIRWHARWEKRNTPKVGETVQVEGAEGMTLRIAPMT